MKTKTLKKLQKTQQAINQFFTQFKKNYLSMKTKIYKIWVLLIFGIMVNLTACNVTRVISTESQAYQKGDTAVHIVTKTTETYNAQKNY